MSRWKRVAPAGVVWALMVVGAGCKTTPCASETLPLHVAWAEPAADDEAIRVEVPSAGAAGSVTVQTFPVSVGATQADVAVDLSQFGGGALGVSITHGNVVVMSATTGVVRDACTPLSLSASDWIVDMPLGPRD